MKNYRRDFCMSKTKSVLAASFFTAAVAGSAHAQNSPAIPAGVQKLHQDDITATLARDADALSALWDDDAVLLQPGAPPIAGKPAIRDFMKQAFLNSPSVKVVKYAPDIRDIQIVGNVAYEWGYFDAAQRSSADPAPQTLHAKFLRVMKRQPDGSWKFTRIMWVPD
jgi:uncharacterized protein (TIGR02246 family)